MHEDARRLRRAASLRMPTSPPSSIFEIKLNRRIWRVTLDGAFYGDYRTRGHAGESAEAAALALRKQGRIVSVVAPTEERA